jgi:hypothetical protein
MKMALPPVARRALGDARAASEAEESAAGFLALLCARPPPQNTELPQRENRAAVAWSAL